MGDFSELETSGSATSQKLCFGALQFSNSEKCEIDHENDDATNRLKSFTKGNLRICLFFSEFALIT